MAGSGVTLPFPPYKAQLVDSNGVMTNVWQQWFQQMYVRIGAMIAVPNVAAVQNSRPLAALFVGSTNTTVYMSPTGQSTVIDSFTATNTDIQAQTITVYLVPVNGSPGPLNLSVNAQLVLPGATVTLATLQNQVIGGGGFISALSSKPSAVVIAISGRAVS